MTENSQIKITVLECGTVNIRASDAYIKDKRLFEDRITLPNNVFLLQHPVHGNILFDTGWASDCREKLTKELINLYNPQITPEKTAKSQLSALGIEPEDIDLLVLTHLDADHTSALCDFAGKAKRIVCSELEYFYSCRNVYKRRESWDSWMPWADCIERIYMRSSVMGPVKRGFDIFGDDSVICIYTPGHTDGIFTTIISRSPSNRFAVHGDGIYGGKFCVIASDVAFSQKNIDDEVVTGAGFDRKQQLNALRFLKELQLDINHEATLFSHSVPENSTITF